MLLPVNLPDPKKIEAVIKSEPRVLTKWREAMKQQGKRDLPNNIKEVEVVAGTSKAYTLSRLEKDHPELFERVNSETADLPKSKFVPKWQTFRFGTNSPVDASPGRWEIGSV